MALADPGGDGADADFADQLDGDVSLGVTVLQVEDQLGQIFNRVDIVVRRRRDQGDPRNAETQLADVFTDLVAGQLSALAGLGALGDLDLQLVSVDKVVGSDAEASRRDLLDGAAAQVAVGVRSIATWVFPPLAGVGLATDPVHGDGQGLVSFGGNGTEAHGSGAETLDDGTDRFNLFERNRLVRAL